MQKKQAFYDKAQMLYVESGLSLARISTLTTVSERSLSDWKKDGNWSEKRKNFIKMQHSCCANMYKMLTGLTNQVNDQLLNGEEIDKGLVFSIEKIAKSIPKLRPYEKDTIHEEIEPDNVEKINLNNDVDLITKIVGIMDDKFTK